MLEALRKEDWREAGYVDVQVLNVVLVNMGRVCCQSQCLTICANLLCGCDLGAPASRGHCAVLSSFRVEAAVEADGHVVLRRVDREWESQRRHYIWSSFLGGRWQR